jgi:hypothetical protein
LAVSAAACACCGAEFRHASVMSELGLPILTDNVLRAKINEHCNEMVAEATKHPDMIRRFPGTMPLSLSRRHLQMIANNDYVALEKSDGTRYMLLTLPKFVALIDRRQGVYLVEPNPVIPSFMDPTKPQENTLLDGELTYNLALSVWEYLIYDAVAIDGDTSVAQLDFRQRLRAAESFVTAPRVWTPSSSGMLRLRVKDIYEKHAIRSLFKHIVKDPKARYIYLNHARRDGVMCNENDGVIFAPCKMPYVVKNCSALLKWKPPHLNSVDFALELERAVDPRSGDPSVRTYIAYRSEQGNRRMREVYFPSKLKRTWAAEFNKYNNSIIELAYERAAGEWRYIRQREDKDTPNFSATVIDTMESIAESMDREELTVFLERKSAPIPASVQTLVEEYAANRAICTFKDDLFDHSNPRYITTTSISRIASPFVPPPPRSRGPPPRQNQNGVPPLRSNQGESHPNTTLAEPEDDRLVVYEDDI